MNGRIRGHSTDRIALTFPNAPSLRQRNFFHILLHPIKQGRGKAFQTVFIQILFGGNAAGFQGFAVEQKYLLCSIGFRTGMNQVALYIHIIVQQILVLRDGIQLFIRYHKPRSGKRKRNAHGRDGNGIPFHFNAAVGRRTGTSGQQGAQQGQRQQQGDDPIDFYHIDKIPFLCEITGSLSAFRRPAKLPGGQERKIPARTGGIDPKNPIRVCRATPGRKTHRVAPGWYL